MSKERKVSCSVQDRLAAESGGSRKARHSPRNACRRSLSIAAEAKCYRCQKFGARRRGSLGYVIKVKRVFSHIFGNHQIVRDSVCLPSFAELTFYSGLSK